MSGSESKSRALLNPNYASVRCIQPMPGMINLRREPTSNHDEVVPIYHDSQRAHEVNESNYVNIESPKPRRFMVADDDTQSTSIEQQYVYASQAPSTNHNYYEPAHEIDDSNQSIRLVNSLDQGDVYENVDINVNQNANKKIEFADPPAHENSQYVCSDDKTGKILPQNQHKEGNSEMFEYMNFEEGGGGDEQKRPLTAREKMKNFLHSKPCHIAIIVLVLVDCVLVVAEILIDLELVEVDEESPAPEIVHYCSISILSIFMLEILAKVIADWQHFRTHKIEILDAIVVITAFTFDVYLLFVENEALVAVELLVLLRLWRVVRLVNGIILTVKNEADQRVHELKAKLKIVEDDLKNSQETIENLEKDIEKLKEVLKQNGIHYEEEHQAQEGSIEPENGAVLRLNDSDHIISIDT